MADQKDGHSLVPLKPDDNIQILIFFFGSEVNLSLGSESEGAQCPERMAADIQAGFSSHFPPMQEKN